MGNNKYKAPEFHVVDVCCSCWSADVSVFLCCLETNWIATSVTQQTEANSTYYSGFMISIAVPGDTAQKNQNSLKLNPETVRLSPAFGCCVPFCSADQCVCVCVCVWRANGRISQSYLSHEMTAELTGSDALFINKDSLKLHWGQYLERKTHKRRQSPSNSKAKFWSLVSFCHS